MKAAKVWGQIPKDRQSELADMPLRDAAEMLPYELMILDWKYPEPFDDPQIPDKWRRFDARCFYMHQEVSNWRDGLVSSR